MVNIFDYNDAKCALLTESLRPEKLCVVSLALKPRGSADFRMALVLRYGTYKNFWEGVAGNEILAETRLNLLALDYGYKYRLDIRPKNGLSRVEFVRTLREARFVGMPIRRSKGVVQFYKLLRDGTLKRHQW